jgi:predicted ester cyclase
LWSTRSLEVLDARCLVLCSVTWRNLRAMDATERERRVRTFVEEVWNKRNYEAAQDLYAATFTNGFGTGPAARVEPIRRYHEAFPDLRIEIEEIIVCDEAVVLRSTFRGTDTGGYVGRPPTGRVVEEWVVTIMHFDGERVVWEWIGADKLGLFIQLGVVDDPWPK